MIHPEQDVNVFRTPVVLRDGIAAAATKLTVAALVPLLPFKV